MKTLLVFLLVCLSSLALALGDPHKSEGAGLSHSLQAKHSLMSDRSMSHRMAPHSTLGTTNSQGYHPWVEQVTALPSGTKVGPIHAVDSNVVWAGVWGKKYSAVILTTNGGATWICDTIKIAPTTYWIRGIYAVDASRCWVTMDDTTSKSTGGIFRTTDGGVTWTQDPVAFKTGSGWINFIYFFDANNGVCGGDPTNAYFEIYTTSNGGASWSRVPSTKIAPKLFQEWGGDMLGVTAAGNSVWFPTFNSSGGTGRYYKTTDRGLTWSVSVYPAALPGWSPTLGFQDDNVGLGNCDWGEVSRTTDGGSNWTRISSPSHLGFNQIAHISGTTGMYVGSAVWEYPSLKEGYLYSTVYTTDGGTSWTWASTEDGYYLTDVASATAAWRRSDGPNIYKWTMAQGRVIGTSVDSLNFVALSAGLKSDTIAVDAVNFGSESLTVSGIGAPGDQFTVVSQPTFPALIPPLGSVRVRLCFAPSKSGVTQDSIVFVSNASNAPRTSVYLEGAGASATAVEATASIPKAFELSQNYPNPFNPATNFEFRLPAGQAGIANCASTTLKVFDVLGREVATLVDEIKQAGEYKVTWDAAKMASGIYFYRLQAGAFVETKKMMLIK
jgi:hypothetical protein